MLLERRGVDIERVTGEKGKDQSSAKKGYRRHFRQRTQQNFCDRDQSSRERRTGVVRGDRYNVSEEIR